MYLEDYNCALCADHMEETSLHLFWDCGFAWSCWNKVLPHRPRGISSVDEICIRLEAFPCDIALDIILASCWSIWLVRNDIIFRNAAPHLRTWEFYLKDTLMAAVYRAKPGKAKKIRDWIVANL